MGRAPAQVRAGSNVGRGLGGFEALSRRSVLSGSCRIRQFRDDAWLKLLGDLRSRVRSARAGLTLQTNGPAPRPPNAAPHILPSRQALAAFRSFLSAPAPLPAHPHMATRRLQMYGLTAAVAIGVLWLFSHSFSVDRDYSELGSYPPGDAPPRPVDHEVVQNPHQTHTSPATLRRRNVTFATSFVYHGDVYMTLAKSMGDVMDVEEAPTQISIFAQPFPFGFQEIVEDYGLWKHQGVRAEHEKFVDFLNAETGDGAVDLVVLGTCQYEYVFSRSHHRHCLNGPHALRTACHISTKT